MATQVEQLAEDRVRLTVDVPAHDVHHAVEHAADDLAQSVKVPGFRKGKVPRQVLLQRVGHDRLMTEAVESHIGGWFWNAAARSRVRPIAQPEYDFELPGSDAEDWHFTATFPVQATPDLLMGDLLKNMRSSQIFSVCGLPEIDVRRRKKNGKNGDTKYEVELLGLDVFDPVTMQNAPRRGGDVPAWVRKSTSLSAASHTNAAQAATFWSSCSRSILSRVSSAV